MSLLDRVVVALAVFVAFQHLGFFALESFLWEKPAGLKVFRQTPAQASATALLAKNQGVYNAFLAAGLFWGVKVIAAGGIGYVEFSRSIFLFFFSCVAIAGIVGGMTVNKRIFFVQAVPALLGWIATLLASNGPGL